MKMRKMDSMKSWCLRSNSLPRMSLWMWKKEVSMLMLLLVKRSVKTVEVGAAGGSVAARAAAMHRM